MRHLSGWIGLGAILFAEQGDQGGEIGGAAQVILGSFLCGVCGTQ